jgi:hypothetical protein
MEMEAAPPLLDFLQQPTSLRDRCRSRTRGKEPRTRSQEERRALASPRRPRWKKDGVLGRKTAAENARTATVEERQASRKLKTRLAKKDGRRGS